MSNAGKLWAPALLVLYCLEVVVLSNYPRVHLWYRSYQSTPEGSSPPQVNWSIDVDDSNPGTLYIQTHPQSTYWDQGAMPKNMLQEWSIDGSANISTPPLLSN